MSTGPLLIEAKKVRLVIHCILCSFDTTGHWWVELCKQLLQPLTSKLPPSFFTHPGGEGDMHQNGPRGWPRRYHQDSLKKRFVEVSSMLIGWNITAPPTTMRMCYGGQNEKSEPRDNDQLLLWTGLFCNFPCNCFSELERTDAANGTTCPGHSWKVT